MSPVDLAFLVYRGQDLTKDWEDFILSIIRISPILDPRISRYYQQEMEPWEKLRTAFGSLPQEYKMTSRLFLCDSSQNFKEGAANKGDQQKLAPGFRVREIWRDGECGL